MKNKNYKKSIKDIFAFGGTAMNIDSPSEDLAQAQNIAQQAMIGAMSDSSVTGLRGLGTMLTNTGMSMMGKGFASGSGEDSKMGNFLKNNMGSINSIVGLGQSATMRASGGKIGKSSINAEGGEVVDTPNGVPVELNGPSHASGGIDLEVPQGTEIYSKRLKGEDGKSMADRKKKREKEISRVQKLLEKDPTNITLKKTLAKIKSNNDFIDEKDLSQMEFVKSLVNTVQNPKFAFGGTVGKDGFPTPYKQPDWMKGLTLDSLQDSFGFVDSSNWGDIDDNNYYYKKGTVTPEKNNTYYSSSDKEDLGLNPDGTNSNKGFNISSLFGNITAGDAIGMGANLFGPNAQMKNIAANKAATPTEQNAFKNFGDQALKKIQSQYGYINSVRDQQLQDAELSRQGTINRNNNSARSINIQRALNLATDAQMNELKSNIYNQFAAQTMGIIGQEAGQMAQNDQVRMTGEERRAERELQNTDNFYSNIGKAISDKYKGIGETGKALNQTKQRETTNEILKSIYPNFEYDPYTGKLIAKKTETLETEKATEADVKRKGVTKETNSDLYTKDGKPTAKFIKDYEENPEKYNYKNSKGERATPTEIADVLYRQSKNKYIQNLEEFDTTYKTKSIDGKKFTSNLDYKNALDAGRTDIRDWNTFKGTPTVGTYKGKQLNSTIVDKIENILQEYNLNVDTSDPKSVKALQKILGVKQTGNFGDETIEVLLKK